MNKCIRLIFLAFALNLFGSSCVLAETVNSDAPGHAMVMDHAQGMMVMVTLNPTTPKSDTAASVSIVFHDSKHNPLSVKNLSLQWTMPAHGHNLDKIRPLPQRTQGEFKARTSFPMAGEYVAVLKGETRAGKFELFVPIEIALSD